MKDSIKKIASMAVLALILAAGSEAWHTEVVHAAPESAAATVNLNQASTQELQTVRGIGPVIAEKIVQYRQDHGPFETIEDLTNVNGIGEAKLQKIKSQVTL